MNSNETDSEAPLLDRVGVKYAFDDFPLLSVSLGISASVKCQKCLSCLRWFAGLRWPERCLKWQKIPERPGASTDVGHGQASA